MKNLIAELLIKLAEKEEASKELLVQVEAMEIVLTAMLRKMDAAQFNDMAAGIARAMPPVAPGTETAEAQMLRNYIEKLLNHPRV